MQETYTRSNSLSDVSNFLSAYYMAETLCSFIGKISEILYLLIVPTNQQMLELGAWPEV